MQAACACGGALQEVLQLLQPSTCAQTFSRQAISLSQKPYPPHHHNMQRKCPCNAGGGMSTKRNDDCSQALRLGLSEYTNFEFARECCHTRVACTFVFLQVDTVLVSYDGMISSLAILPAKYSGYSLVRPWLPSGRQFCPGSLSERI